MASLEEKHNLKELCDKALSSKNNYSFRDLCNLVERAGFVFRNQKGSHLIYKHPSYFSEKSFNVINLQPDKNKPSKAKSYQVKQVVDFIREAKPKK
jgi:predicted RNA binding protein YcfA (HicA-like mRNA interferase family)